MHPLVNIAVSAARLAGDIIMQHVDKLDRVRTREKNINDLVSEVDLKAEQAIIQTIHKAHPKHSILAEESGEMTLADEDTVWIIDPLDGTTNFLHGFPHFAVSIGISIKGKIEHGVVFDPVRQECFSASRGRGAQLNSSRIRTSRVITLDKSLLGTGFPSRNKKLFPKYLHSFDKAFHECAGIRRAGACALDLAYVASGRLDGFWEYGLKPWDIAAGSLLVTEAGGLVSDMQGGHSYLKSGEVVATNGKLLKPLLKTIKSDD